MTNPVEMRLTNDGEAEIMLYGQIGRGENGEGVTAQKFVGELKKLGSPSAINVHINSVGGSIIEGIGIYEALRGSRVKIHTHVDGVALSMGSVIAMAGDERSMAANALMMMHDPRVTANGTAESLRNQANVLDKFRDSLAAIYAERTQTDPKDIKEMMARETWLSAPEAKAIRFVTKITPARKAAAYLDPADVGSVPDRFRELVAEFTTQAPEKKPMAENTPNVVPQFTAEEVAALKAQAAMKLVAEPLKITPPEAIDTAKIVADAQAAEQKRCSMIADKCKLLGVADLAGDLIGDKALSIENALAKIIDESAKRNPSAGANDGKQKSDPPDENQAYRDEYKAQEKLFAAAGMSVDAYVSTRRIDDGLDQLTTKQPA